jgi:hypothetical protein
MPVTAAPAGQAGASFGSLYSLSIKRAFRLRIEPSEVLPAERAALEVASPPVRDPSMQAFLAWRRSVLLVVAVALVPLSVLRLIDALDVDIPGSGGVLKFLGVMPALAEAFFAVLCLAQLKQWTHWRTQRRTLFLGWLVFLAAPFLVYLYPLETVVDGIIKAQLVAANGGADVDLTAAMADPAAQQALGAVRMMATSALALSALITLAPKAVSLMPGLMRAGIVSKMLFPGATAPGWLLVLGAPVYFLFLYSVLIVPYQLTGSGWFVGGILAIGAGQLILAKAGYALARPLDRAGAVAEVGKARSAYLASMVAAAVLIVIAVARLAEKLDFSALTVFTTLMSFATNVLVLTLIGTDLVISSLERARQMEAGSGGAAKQTDDALAAFVSDGA